MFVVGATKSDFLKHLRNILPDNFLPLPGVGLKVEIYRKLSIAVQIQKIKILINVSRSIIMQETMKILFGGCEKVDELNNSFNLNKKDCYREVTALYN